jgi:hypothetical protein
MGANEIVMDADACSERGKKPRYGVDVINGKVADTAAKGIYEPLRGKEEVMNAATEVACMVLRIDNVIAASKPKESGMAKPGAGGMPGGADMDMYEVGNSFYSPFYFSLWTELCSKKSTDESFVMKGVDLPLA